MTLSTKEKQAINMMAARIDELASLENAGFDMDKEKSDYIKSKIKPYMMWFKCVSGLMRDFAKAEDRYDKQGVYERVYRDCPDVD